MKGEPFWRGNVPLDGGGNLRPKAHARSEMFRRCALRQETFSSLGGCAGMHFAEQVKREISMSFALKTVVIPAAGLGTRLLPLTKSVPKELLPVYDLPTIQFALDEAVAAGAEHIIVVVGPQKMALRDYLNANRTLVEHLERSGKHALSAAVKATGAPRGTRLTVVEQAKPKGLGHAIHCCAPYLLRKPFAVILPDDVILSDEPALSQMAKVYGGGHMVAAQMVRPDEVSGYGIFRPVASGARIPGRGAVKVAGMVEKPLAHEAPSCMAAVGRYILDPAILGHLALQQPGAGGEIQLTDAIAADAAFMDLNAFLFEGERFDCGAHEGLLRASLARRAMMARPEQDLVAAE